VAMQGGGITFTQGASSSFNAPLVSISGIGNSFTLGTGSNLSCTTLSVMGSGQLSFGDLGVVNASASLYLDSQAGMQVNGRVTIVSSGNATFMSGSLVDGSGRGFNGGSAGTGPGCPSTNAGASHGGCGFGAVCSTSTVTSVSNRV